MVLEGTLTVLDSHLLLRVSRSSLVGGLEAVLREQGT